MGIISRIALKNIFKTGNKPAQKDFGDMVDSFMHREDAIAISKVTGLSEKLENSMTAADKETILTAMETQETAWSELKDQTVLKYNDAAETVAEGVLRMADEHSAAPLQMKYTETWHDGTPMDDSKADGVMFAKIGEKYFRRAYDNYINAAWFGVLPSSSDNSAALQSAIDFIKKIESGTLYIQRGNYTLKSTVYVDYDGLTIKGDGSKATMLEIAHNGTGITYDSKVPDLSTARFILEKIGIKNTLNNVSFPIECMQGVGVHCIEMHCSIWQDVYIENFEKALILEESYLNSFHNYVAQANWRGLFLIGGSNGNVFYGGVCRNAAIDLRGYGAERNRFVGMDFEPSSDTCYLGNNNFFDNCRFERFNLIHQDYKRTWLVLGDGNNLNECDFHYNFADRPQGWMVIVEGNKNKVVFKHLNITSNILKIAGDQNDITFTNGFEDFVTTGSVKTSGIKFVDFGIGNKVTMRNTASEVTVLDCFETSAFGGYKNICPDDWPVSANVNALMMPANDLQSAPLKLLPTDNRINKILATTSINTQTARRIKSSVLEPNSTDTLYSASVWVFVPETTDLKFIGVGIQEGNLTYYDNRENIQRTPKNKWFLLQATAIINTPPVFTMDFLMDENQPVYIALASVVKGETYSV